MARNSSPFPPCITHLSPSLHHTSASLYHRFPFQHCPCNAILHLVLHEPLSVYCKLHSFTSRVHGQTGHPQPQHRHFTVTAMLLYAIFSLLWYYGTHATCYCDNTAYLTKKFPITKASSMVTMEKPQQQLPCHSRSKKWNVCGSGLTPNSV